MQNKFLLYISTVLTLAACSNEVVDDVIPAEDGNRALAILSDIEPFAGEGVTRVNVAGNAFLDGDKIRIKIICPFVSSTERGEANWTTSDAFFYLKYSSSENKNAWVRVVVEDGYDLSGTYSPSNSPNISDYYEVQQTPYVFVATTWSEERRFVAPNLNGNSTVYDHLTPVFHADQTKEEHYRASDVLWAQTFMQTGAWNIHLGFKHKMACLDIYVDDSNLTQPNPDFNSTNPESSATIPAPISDNAVLTLEGMPDIDQAEIVVGDYYADASKSNTNYGYQQKSSCGYELNGLVLGVAVNDETAKRAKVAPLSGLEERTNEMKGIHTSAVGTVPNTGIYTAYHQKEGETEHSHHYRLIVPPCRLPQYAVFWLRDGSRRFKINLTKTVFDEGKLYKVSLKLGEDQTPGEDSNPGSDPDPDPEQQQ